MINFILTFLSVLLSTEFLHIKYSGYMSLFLFTLLFSIVNGIIKPIIKFLSIPINFLTLGLFSIVINIGMILLIGFFAGKFFNIDSHKALILVIVLILVQWLLHLFKR